MPVERVSLMEQRYRHLSLEHLGAFGVESDGDPWTPVSWRLCGRDHFILERDTIVRGMLVVPAEVGPSKSAIASCPGEGDMALQLANIISPASGRRVSRLLPGVWLIDDQDVRFVRRSSAAIGCVELGS